MTNLKPFKDLNLGVNPNGQNASLAALKYWIPTGINKIVMQQIIPQKKKIAANSQPINANQVTLAKVWRKGSCLILDTIKETMINTNNTAPAIINAIAHAGNDVPLLSPRFQKHNDRRRRHRSRQSLRP